MAAAPKSALAGIMAAHEAYQQQLNSPVPEAETLDALNTALSDPAFQASLSTIKLLSDLLPETNVIKHLLANGTLILTAHTTTVKSQIAALAAEAAKKD